MGSRSCTRFRVILAAVVGSAAILAPCPQSIATDAPLFTRPFDGVPVPAKEPLLRIVPLERINFENDDQR